VKIKEVNIIKNKDPVYDIELTPCKFFIAGNKPMNIFDTIRKFTKRPWTPTQLMYLRTISPEMLAYLWILIEYEKNIMIIGGTGSGKTSMLNGLSFFIPPQARVVSIEDTRELNIEHINWLPSVARSGVGLANLVGQKYGEVTLFNLLKESFRMNPDYVIVGEVRGEEAFVLFQGMASIKGDEKILLLNHNKPKNIKIKDLKPGIEYKAICLDKNGKIKIMPIKKRVIHPERKELYKITTKTGRKITLTPNHSILKHEKGNIISIYADNLKEGEDILIPAKIPSGYANESHLNLMEELPNARVFAPTYIKEAVKKLGYQKASQICEVKSISDFYSNFKRSKPSSLKIDKFKKLMKEAKINYNINNLKIKYDNNSKSLPCRFKITNEFLRLLGYYISEGTLQNKRKNSRLCLYAKRKEILNDMEKCIIKVAGEKPVKRKTKGFGTSYELSFSHKTLISLIEKHCGKTSKHKTIPDFIFGLSKQRIGQFLSALYSGDGTFTNNYYGYFTISKDLADKLAKLLLVFGIVSYIRERKRKNKDYEIVFYRYNQKKTFLEYVKPLRQKIPLGKPSNKKETIINDFYIDKIKEIRKINLKSSQPVYDISVQGSRNFIGGFGGILLHNSGHPSFGTMHANDIDTMIKRLETPPINLSPSLVETMDAVLVMVNTRVGGKAVRRVREITEIISVVGSKANTNTVFTWNPATDSFMYSGQSYIFQELVTQEGIQESVLLNEFRRRSQLLTQMYNKGVFEFSAVQRVINDYYRSPEQVLLKFGVEP
jgi:flagellar protein FlaI